MAVRRSIWIPGHRFVSVVERKPDYREELQGTEFVTRTIRRLKDGTQRFVSLNVADRILVKLDMVHWFQIPKDEGGLADIYVDGKQYGAPDRSHTRQQRPNQQKYETELERREARLQTYRNSYQRRKDRRAA